MSQNGGPGPSQKWSCTRTALKTAQYAIRTLFAMFSSHRPLPKHLIFDTFLLPKSDEKQGAAPRSPKRPQKRGPGRHHDAPWGPHGPPRVPRGGPGEPQSVPKFIKNLSGKGDGKRVWQLSRTGFSAKSVSVVEESLGRKETFIMTMYR